MRAEKWGPHLGATKKSNRGGLNEFEQGVFLGASWKVLGKLWGNCDGNSIPSDKTSGHFKRCSVFVVHFTFENAFFSFFIFTFYRKADC